MDSAVPKIKLRDVGNGVFQAEELIIHAGPEEIRFLESKLSSSARKRTRICAHPGPQEKLHEMFIALSRGTYLRPSLHIGKEESLHVLEGAGDYVFFDQKGAIEKVVRLKPYGSGGSFYLRTPPNVWHALVVCSEVLMIHEITTGPFRKEDTVYAPWAPEDTDPAAAAYLDRLISDADAFVRR